MNQPSLFGDGHAGDDSEAVAEVTVYADGGARGNPGPAAIGAVVLDTSEEPPRQLAGFQRVSLAPGQSRQVTFEVTPRSEEWWDAAANGWSSSPGAYGVYVGDSSALSDLPPGCVFAPRCPYAEDRCRAAFPAYEEKRPGHWAACWRSREIAGGRNG